MTSSEALAGFAAQLTRTDLPDQVVDTVKRHLLDTVGVDDFDQASIDDPKLLELAAKVETPPDPDSDYPARFPGRIEVLMSDGRVLQHDEPIHRGSAERPLSDREVEEKFASNARRALSDSAAATLRERIGGLENLQDAGELLAALGTT